MPNSLASFEGEPSVVPSPTPLARIRRLSLIVAGCCFVALVGIPLLMLAFWFLADAPLLSGAGNLSSAAIRTPLHVWQRLAGAGISLLGAVPLWIALWHTRRCFHLLAVGEYFAVATICHLRGFAAWMFVATFAGLLVRPALSVLLTIYNPPGSRMLSVSLSGQDFLGAFVAGVLWVIAAVMSHARALAEENAQFV
jgi:hypothetical protein